MTETHTTDALSLTAGDDVHVVVGSVFAVGFDVRGAGVVDASCTASIAVDDEDSMMRKRN